MKKLFITLILILGSISMQAQELDWHTNVKEAVAIGNKKKKPVLLFFTGSDWCGWCVRLQKEVFNTPEFAKWAKQNVILVELDFPRRTPQTDEIKKQNNELQQAFQIQGYPTICFVNGTSKNGKVNFEGLGNTGYVSGGPTAWINVANEILRKK